MPGTPLQLSVSPSSSASQSSADDFGHIDNPFGDHIVGDGNFKPSSLTDGLVRDLVIGLAVALAARYLWAKIK